MKLKNTRFLQKTILITIDILIIIGATLLAYLSVERGKLDLSAVGFWALCNVTATVILFSVCGLYDIVFSYVGMHDIFKNIVLSFVLGVLNFIFSITTGQVYITLGMVLVYILLFSCFTILARASKRIFHFVKRYFEDKTDDKKRIMIVGGGEAGEQLIKDMQRSDRFDYKPVCVVDDNPEKIGGFISGVKVAGATKDIVDIAMRFDVEEIFITMPSVPKKRVSEIVNLCKDCGCPIKILPGLFQFTSGEISVSALRKVDIQDLLGREQINVNLDEIMGYIENKVVLVTGGGGSIGSELCRQIASHKPKQLIVLDIYENNAYDLEQELKRKYAELDLLTLIASVRDMTKMENVFEKHRPQIVFHAAAHKHVPLMETSPNEAVKNNVFGTLNVAKCADKYEVETFVQISTDKAVNPTNIMGATKRICEMIIQTIGRHSKKTKFVAVRFGNVLGSNGSVIPLFKKQIEEGGPVTVTHKDIIRYFMTIPEAVSLVLQAGAYAKGGQIFVLDMGEPVRIYDLAENLIKLSGYEPNVDIDIVVTGLRPGEKLYEERLMKEEGLQKTPNGLINIAKPIEMDEENLWTMLEKLDVETHNETEEMKTLVKELVPTYTIDKRA